MKKIVLFLLLGPHFAAMVAGDNVEMREGEIGPRNLKGNGIHIGALDAYRVDKIRRASDSETGCPFEVEVDPEEDELTAEVVRGWSELTLDMITESFGFLSPPGVARALSMVTTAEWNAVVPYTTDAIPVVVGGEFEGEVERVPRDDVAIREAVSIAAFLVLAEIFDPEVKCLGASARDKALPLLETEGLEMLKEYARVQADSVQDAVQELIGGNQVAVETMDFIIARRYDGMNSRGDLSVDGLCYSDEGYTLYESENDPQPDIVKTDCSELKYIDKWQQIRVPTDDNGGWVLRPWLAPYMARVTPFTPETSSLWMTVKTPPAEGNPEFKRQHTEVIEISAGLDDREKIIAEYWADGPDSNLPPGHWHDIALYMTEKKHLSAFDTLRLLFLQGQAVFDAGIAAWAVKRFYDSARPLTAIQCLYEGDQVRAWAGPYQGTGMIDASDWVPYQNHKFVTPPFAEYVSGHSTFSEASATILRNFLGSDEYGDSFTVKEGTSLFEPKIDDPNDPYFVEGLTNVPNTGPGTPGYVPAQDVTLSWATFTEAALEAGVSRLYGGIHIDDGNTEGLYLGGRVGKAVWKKYQSLLNDCTKTIVPPDGGPSRKA